MFTPEEVAELTSARPLSRLPHPVPSIDENEAHYRGLVGEWEEATGSVCRPDWGHYGSGYASFVDLWFYLPGGEARCSTKDEHHEGVFVLLSRLTNLCVFGQGQKSWYAKGGGSYMPCLELVDTVEHPALVALTANLEPLIKRAGFERVRRWQLEGRLMPKVRVPTILCDPPYHWFDAVFYWED